MTTSKYYYSGKFGIERETLRVDGQGRLAQSPHPFGNDEHITRDFCENQVELVTPVCYSVDEAVEALAELDKRARDELTKNGESIWLYSNPPHFDSEDDIPIAEFT
ncbi:MAG: glutathione synthase, partial [Ruminococcus sp.]|nr:glutathione synthase [Ruminococcus sp.]